MAASDHVPIFFENRWWLVQVGTGGQYGRPLALGFCLYRRTPSWGVPSCANLGLGTPIIGLVQV